MADSVLIARKTNASEEKRKAKCLEQLSQDRQRLVMRWPFIGGLILRLGLVPVRDDRLSTASTNGENIYVDIDFYKRLTAEERQFVLAHEVMHVALMHFNRKQNRDFQRFNYAADLEIHFALLDEAMKEPWVLPHDEAWKGLSAEEIYDRLESLSKKNKGKRGKANKTDASGGQQGGDSAQDDQTVKNSAEGQPSEQSPQQPEVKNTAGQTDESPSADGASKHHDKDKFGDGQSSFDKHIYGGDSGMSDGKRPDEMTSAEAAARNKGQNEMVMDDDYRTEMPADVVERVRSCIIGVVQQVERTRGMMPSWMTGILEKLAKPQLPWQELLKQFVTMCYGGKRQWLPPSRRHVWQELYLPSMREERLKAVVALDTSGSTEDYLEVFFGELVSLLRTFGKFELTVIQCDATIQKVEQFSDNNPPKANHSWEVNGLGGTSFIPVFDYVNEQPVKPDVLLYFTDGDGDAPLRPPSYPVMWILTDDGEKPADWGRAIHFKQPSEQD